MISGSGSLESPEPVRIFGREIMAERKLLLIIGKIRIEFKR